MNEQDSGKSDPDLQEGPKKIREITNSPPGDHDAVSDYIRHLLNQSSFVAEVAIRPPADG